ncbi:unnamed protein product [Phytophthora lilii]|uniref:Unnamed protein product n=1 Tax=Phytophthora lilii TaxID=2077276 RepID=A0A9W6YL75_9STRA|nr:unnamed protein product [Phytophthora lilii]
MLFVLVSTTEIISAESVDLGQSPLRASPNLVEHNVASERLLRVNSAVNAHHSKFSDAEGRTNPISATLGLAELSGKKLTRHPNYKHFQKFLGRKYGLGDLLYKGAPPYSAWVKLGFDDIHTVDQLKTILKTDKFKLYEEYVLAFDRISINNYYSARIPVHVSTGASEAEMTARMTILAMRKKTDYFYAKMVLGLDNLNPQEMVKHGNYRYYQFYLRQVKEMGK